MNERDELRLRHMRDAAANALHFAEGETQTSIEKDLLRAYAIIHAIQIIGEAASQVTPETQKSIPKSNGKALLECVTASCMAMTTSTMELFGTCFRRNFLHSLTSSMQFCRLSSKMPKRKVAYLYKHLSNYPYGD